MNLKGRTTAQEIDPGQDRADGADDAGRIGAGDEEPQPVQPNHDEVAPDQQGDAAEIAQGVGHVDQEARRADPAAEGDHPVKQHGVERHVGHVEARARRSATIPASSLVFTLYNRGQAEVDHPSPDTLFSGVGGNPDLKPYISTNLDASLEREFADFGGCSLAVFHKTIDDYITQTASPERLAFATRAGPPVTATVMMARPRNTGRAQVSGMEIAFSRRWPAGWASGPAPP